MSLDQDNDISIRRQALDLLFTMCDSSNAKVIVSELMEYLNGADVTMREELSLKIAILAEKFATDLSWFVHLLLGGLCIAILLPFPSHFSTLRHSPSVAAARTLHICNWQIQDCKICINVTYDLWGYGMLQLVL